MIRVVLRCWGGVDFENGRSGIPDLLLVDSKWGDSYRDLTGHWSGVIRDRSIPGSGQPKCQSREWDGPRSCHKGGAGLKFSGKSFFIYIIALK